MVDGGLAGLDEEGSPLDFRALVLTLQAANIFFVIIGLVDEKSRATRELVTLLTLCQKVRLYGGAEQHGKRALHLQERVYKRVKAIAE